MNRKRNKAHEAHVKFLSKHGITQKKRYRIKGDATNFPDLTFHKPSAMLSNSIPSNGFKRDLDDHKWKRGAQESREAIQEAERKRKRIAPYTNKGALMYITDDDDKKSLGRKI